MGIMGGAGAGAGAGEGIRQISPRRPGNAAWGRALCAWLARGPLSALRSRRAGKGPRLTNAGKGEATRWCFRLQGGGRYERREWLAVPAVAEHPLWVEREAWWEGEAVVYADDEALAQRVGRSR